MKISREKLIILFAQLILLLSSLYIPYKYAPHGYIVIANLFVMFTIVRIVKEGFIDIPLLFFNITYWVFVLGGCTVSLLTTGDVAEYITITLSEQQLRLICGIAMFGIALLDIVYFFIDRKKAIGKKNLSVTYVSPTKLQKQVVILIFVVAAICKIFMAYEKMAYSTAFGYVSLYTREASNLPTIINYLGAFFYFSLTLLLSCNFSKRFTYVIFWIVVVIELMILKSGDRGEAICAILMLIVYAYYRCKEDSKFLIHKRAVFGISLILTPLIIYILQSLKFSRVGGVMNSSFFESIIDFFESQGVSINIIANGIKHFEEIGNLAGHNFIFGQIFSYMQQNALIRTLLGIPKVAGNTVEMAMSGFSYGSSLMYITQPSSYLNGVGMGTCYLAELFHDGKWLGIIIGTLVIAALLKWMRNADQKNWIVFALMLNCMRVVFLLPRGAYFRWITEMLSVPNLMLLVFILFLSLSQKQRKRTI